MTHFIPSSDTCKVPKLLQIENLHSSSDQENSARSILLSDSESGMIYGGNVAPIDTVERSAIPHSPQRSTPTGRKPLDREQSWSPSLQHLLDQPPSSLPIRFVVGGLVFSCVLGAWAWFGQIQEVSQAQGRLVPKGEVYRVQPVNQGEVTKIAVEEGEFVKAGDTIAILDNRLAEAEVNRLEQTLNNYRFQVIQIQGLIDRTRSEIDTRRAIAAAEIRAQEATIDQARARSETSQQALAQLQTEAAAYESRLARLQPLVEEGVIAQEQLFQAEQALREHQRLMTQSNGELQQSLSEIEGLQAQLSQRQSEGQRSELETQQRLQELEVQLAEVQSKIAETEHLVAAARTKLEQMYLYAPVDGIVSSLNVKNNGEVTQPGQTIAEIAPEGAPLMLSAVLPNRDAGFVREGMDVQIKFDAFPYQDYGIVSGTVTSISPDTKVDEKLGAVYTVEIALESSSAIAAQRMQLKAGQTASAEIITRQRRIIDIFLDPIKKLQQGGINL